MVTLEDYQIIFSMNNFGGIVEGKTDFAIIRNVLAGYFNGPNIKLKPIQPEHFNAPAGWDRVLKCCKSQKFRQALQFNRYIIIHIDTDVSPNFGIPHHDEKGEKLTSEQLIRKVTDKFRLDIGADFYDKYANRIIFAITVHSIECWLLPLYFSEEEKSQTDNCLRLLKQILPEFKEKDYEYYESITSKYSNREDLLKLCSENPSLKIFIEELASRNIEITEES